MLLLVLSVLLGGCRGVDTFAPVARFGVIDLSAAAVRLEHGPVRLDGQWEFYWGNLLTPKDFSRGTAPTPAYRGLPGVWNGAHIRGKTLTGKGYATFRLRILPPALKQEMALRLPNIFSAYRLWIDNKLVAVGGVVGRSRAEEIPNQYVHQPQFRFGKRPVELVLQVSDFHYRDGGVEGPIELGTAAKINADRTLRWALIWLAIGSLLVMGLYHIALYLFRRKDAAPLYFGLFALLWMIFSLFTEVNGRPYTQVFGVIPSVLFFRVSLLCVVLSVPVAYAFLQKLYPREFYAWLQPICWGMAALYLVLAFALPTMTFTSIIGGYYFFTILLTLYCLVSLLRAYRRRREGVVYILFGMFIVGAASTNDMLYDLQIISSVYLTQAGLQVYVVCQMLALSKRFSQAFSSVEQLSDQLTERNLALEEQMQERSRLEREVVTVSEEERRRLSHDLHDGLCQQLTGARLRFAALKRQVGDGAAPDWGRFSSLLDEAVDQAYDLSRGLWPVENDSRDLGTSLEELTRRLSKSSGVAIEFRRQFYCAECRNTTLGEVYRIAQEAVANALKHARAKRIVVELSCVDGENVALRVRDDGIGRSRATLGRGGLGMRIMAHRARIAGGTLGVSDAEGGGTVVTCVVSCNHVEGQSG